MVSRGLVGEPMEFAKVEKRARSSATLESIIAVPLLEKTCLQPKNFSGKRIVSTRKPKK